MPLPPPTELAERSAAIVEQVAAASRRDGQNVGAAVGRLDAVIAHVTRQFGERSVESIQAATEAGIALIRDWQRFDLAHPYIARSLELSRVVFGTDHRETAYALQDLAVVRQELRPELFVQWSGPLAREAIAVRSRVLGADHLETAGSERDLATWLFASWRNQRGASPGSPMLVEAQGLADHALDVLEAAYGVTHFEVVGLRYLRAQVALAMRDYVLAETLADELLYRYEAPCHADSREPGAREMLAEALRGQGRIADFEAAADAAAADGCNDSALTP